MALSDPSPGLRMVGYRARATFRARWAGYLSLLLLVGLLGGVAMGALAAARRTQSSFSTARPVAMGTASWPCAEP